MKKKHRIISYLFVPVVCVCIFGLSIGISNRCLGYMAENTVQHVIEIPKEYYAASGESMARYTAKKLSYVDQLKLITGIWESQMTPCEREQAIQTELAMAQKAKYQISFLHEKGLYPYTLDSLDGNWYTYTSEVFGYEDTNFNAYRAYLWKLTFTRYDHTLKQVVYLTESGTLLYAQAELTKPFSEVQLSQFCKEYAGTLLAPDETKEPKISDVKPISKELVIQLPDLEDQNVKPKSQVQISMRDGDETVDLIVYQLQTTHDYIIGMMRP